VGNLKFSEKYFSARLVEKLKSLDGVHVKDKTLVHQIKQTLVQELISEGLLLNWAQQNHIAVSKDEINELLQSLVSSPKGGVAEDILAESQVNKALLEDSLGVQILKKRLVMELEKKVTVSDAEVQSYYQDHLNQYKKGRIHVKQIFLAKESEADSVMKFLRSGKFTFEALAQKYSMGAEAQNGGDMGWLESGQGPQIDALFNRGPGIYDKVVSSPQGFHIFKILEVQRPAIQPLSLVKESIIRNIKEMKTDGAYLLWSEEQVKKTPIKTNESVISALVPSYQETP
jgi:parvulin-like peptidyl-prolyl isomerase